MTTRKDILHQAIHGYPVPDDYIKDQDYLESRIQGLGLSCAGIYKLFQEIWGALEEQSERGTDRAYYDTEVVAKLLSSHFQIPINDSPNKYRDFFYKDLPQFMETSDNVKHTFNSLWDAFHEISYTNQQIGIFWVAYIELIA
jgi:hypothetical protein